MLVKWTVYIITGYKTLSMLHLNVRSIAKNLHQLRNYLTLLKHNCSFVGKILYAFMVRSGLKEKKTHG